MIPVWMWIIVSISEGEKVSVSKLWARVGSSSATFHKHLNWLEEIGVVEKERINGKTVFVKLTEKGIKLRNAFMEIIDSLPEEGEA